MRRVHYMRHSRAGTIAQVIAEISEDGQTATFYDKELCNVRWYPFYPSPEEIEFALNLLQQGKGNDLDAHYVEPT